MNPSMPDPVIDEIRDIRHRISASCDHDPAKLVAYLMQYQEQFRDRLTYDPTEPSPVPCVVSPDTVQTAESRPVSPALNS